MKKIILILSLSLTCTYLSYCMQSNSRSFLELPDKMQKKIILNAICNGLPMSSFVSTCKSFKKFMEDEKFKWEIFHILCRKTKHEPEKIRHCLGLYRAVNHSLQKEILVITPDGFTRRIIVALADEYKTYPLPLTNYDHYRELPTNYDQYRELSMDTFGLKANNFNR